MYRFVTWKNESGAKRITVAVTVEGPAPEAKPIYASFELSDPNRRHEDSAASRGDTGSGGSAGEGEFGDVVTTLYAYDTPAALGSRQEQTGDHPARDTVRSPDLLGPDAIPNPFAPPKTPPRFNYSTDVAGGVPGGRVIEKANDGCAGRGRTQRHMWVTVPREEPVTLSGGASASLWTQTASGQAGAGALCVQVFDVELDTGGRVKSRRLLGSTTRRLDSWPTEPGLMPVDFRFLDGGDTHVLEAGHVVGVELTVHSGSGSALAILYDHPDYATTFQFGQPDPEG